MDRIVPPMVHTYMLREGQIIEAQAVSELGIYSTFVR